MTTKTITFTDQQVELLKGVVEGEVEMTQSILGGMDNKDWKDSMERIHVLEGLLLTLNNED